MSDTIGVLDGERRRGRRLLLIWGGHNIVSIEHQAGLVSRNRHGNFFWNARVTEILDGRSTEVMNRRYGVPALASILRLRIRPFSKSSFT